jgi:predicted Fe-S protein YdhL (DUF1289 family)
MTPAAKLLLARARTLRENEPVPSPCLSVCRIHPVTGWCEGCLRSLDEVAGWSRMDDAAKRVVWTDIVKRASA